MVQKNHLVYSRDTFLDSRSKIPCSHPFRVTRVSRTFWRRRGTLFPKLTNLSRCTSPREMQRDEKISWVARNSRWRKKISGRNTVEKTLSQALGIQERGSRSTSGLYCESQSARSLYGWSLKLFYEFRERRRILREVLSLPASSSRLLFVVEFSFRYDSDAHSRSKLIRAFGNVWSMYAFGCRGAQLLRCKMKNAWRTSRWLRCGKVKRLVLISRFTILFLCKMPSELSERQKVTKKT